MLYLIGQIVFCLILAAILGFILGWLMRGRSSGKSQGESQSNFQIDGPAAEQVKEELKPERKKVATRAATNKKKSAKSTVKKDDLKKINGIGPVLEKRLNQLGVERFDQIARFSDQDIAMFSAQIGAFSDRIVRDRWVAQAKKLQNK